MICFGAKTDQEVKEKVTCGSHLKIKKKTKQNKQISKNKGKFAERVREKQSERKIVFFLFLCSSLTSFFDIRKSDRPNSSG